MMTKILEQLFDFYHPKPVLLIIVARVSIQVALDRLGHGERPRHPMRSAAVLLVLPSQVGSG